MAILARLIYIKNRFSPPWVQIFVAYLNMDTCQLGNDYNGDHLGARISAVFVIFAVSAIGSFLPLLLKKSTFFKVPDWCFFVTRYFGSGVIVATGFIHLLAEANEALSNTCLGGVWEEYPWAEGICMIGVFLMFFFDTLAHKKIEEKVRLNMIANEEIEQKALFGAKDKDILDQVSEVSNATPSATLYQQMLNALVLEFGIIFHSIFVGLSLAIAGDEFKSLYVAIAFHQCFEGLGLGTRFATTPWPKDKLYVPWCLSLAYSLTTPIAIAIGIGLRQSYLPGSRASLLTTGIFDALCAGILIYNSLVELMAYDFMISEDLKGRNGSLGMRRMLIAFFFLCLGAFAMALIGKWA